MNTGDKIMSLKVELFDMMREMAELQKLVVQKQNELIELEQSNKKP